MNRQQSFRASSFLIVTTLFETSITLAQNPWSSVDSWQATYAWTSSGTGNAGGYRWTISRQLTADSVLTNPSIAGNTILWNGTISTGSDSGASNGTGSPACDVISWSGGASSPGAFVAPLRLFLLVDFSKNSCLLGDNAVLPAKATENDCGTKKLSLDLGLTVGPNYGGGMNPPSFSLPATYGVIQQTVSFTSPVPLPHQRKFLLEVTCQ